MTIKIVNDLVSIPELWEAMWGCEASPEWVSKVRKPDGSGISLWTKPDYEPNPQDFKVYDIEEEKWHTVTLDDLVRGYTLAVKTNAKHCGHYAVSDLEDPDACTLDIILQLAIFGEVIYG